jgi:hypothetical protein
MSRASSQVAGVPGTPDRQPAGDRIGGQDGDPVLDERVLSISAGAVSRPSMVWTRPDRASQ